MHALILRLEAPLMAFGGVAIDEDGVTDRFPAASMLTGLLANALGWDHRDFAPLQRLQRRLLFAARLDAVGTPLEDYQVADLGAEPRTWTTRGVPAERGKGPGAQKALRVRHYHADACCVVALALAPPGEAPSLKDIAAALRRPARPLFIGRKPCLPACPILAGEMDGESALAILARWPRDPARDDGRAMPARWPAGDAHPGARGRELWVSDLRDWGNQAHTGNRPVCEGELALAPAPGGEGGP